MLASLAIDTQWTRRNWLRGAVALSAVGMTADSWRAGAEPGTARDTRSAGADWKRLSGRIEGRVITSADGDYGTAKQLFNTRFDGLSPAAVVQVAAPGDVAAAVTFAAEHGLRVAARSGGHSYAGASAATGALIVDLRNLNQLRYHDGAAVVGPGNSLYDVYTALDRYGRTIPAGVCPGVGIAGLTLGGGVGVESRLHGLTCDHLTSASLVLPDGTEAEVSATSHPDLFWAVRGAGAYVGIVTSLTYRTVPATAKDVVSLSFPGDRTGRCIDGWNHWLRSADRSHWANITVAADGHGGLRCAIQLVCPAGTGAHAAAALIEATTEPLTVDTQSCSSMDTVQHLVLEEMTRRTSYTNGSDVLTHLDDSTIEQILAAITEHSRAGGTGWVQLDPLDGAVRDTNPVASAFPWRNHAALIQWGAFHPIPADAARAWIGRAHHLLRKASAGSYVNYIGPGDSLQRCYAHNAAMLAALRRTVDPRNRIHTPTD
ncbi:FAD-binding oxidoreductase [Nocardia goodfellowii]|uniref:FAD/FMN-containing dehydrogenase n=1 Tax=Nocardia goodfellowii TaxID=882446 RepID=A0ABS4QPV4_9NOCA|nr:FAD-binding oxidoreductase [Nocardia goodfellowii]MBP2193133.1 FAD/FMN-containing dehydrogenase [Nocardia goodfellowii]